jgi:PleD family two-component response regulator
VGHLPKGSAHIGVAQLEEREGLDDVIARADRDLYSRRAILGSENDG